MANLYKKHLNRSMVIIIFLSYMALCTTPSYNITILFIPILAMMAIPVAEILQQRTRFYSPCSTMLTVAFLCFLPVYTLSNGLMDSVIILFMYIQIYSLLHTKDRSNYMHILMMSLFLLITTLVLSPTPIVGFIFVALLYFTISSFLHLDTYHHLCNSTSLSSPIKSSRPSDDKSKRLLSFSPLFSRALTLCTSMLCMTLLLFIFIPRTESGIFAASLQIERNRAGQAEEVRFDIVGKITGNSNQVMKVNFINQPDGRYDEEKYWRATTLDKYSAQGWSRQGLLTRPNARNVYKRNFRNRNLYIGYARRVPYTTEELLTYEVFFPKRNLNPAPLLNSVVSIKPTKPQLRISTNWVPGGDFTISIKSSSKLNDSYSVTSQVIRPSANELRQSSNAYMDIMLPSDYHLLTEHNLQDRTLNLVKELTADKETTYDKIIALENYLTTNDFLYTDNVPKLDEHFPLDNFIHDVKQGHCELYAGAMAVMVRSLGVPTRTVSGYRGGQWNDLDNTYTISENMAHLWLEVFFPEFGWVLFDPTPSYTEPEMTRIERIQARIDYTLNRMRIFWQQYIILYKPKFEFE